MIPTRPLVTTITGVATDALMAAPPNWHTRRIRQDALVRRIVHHAWRSVPHYRTLMDEAGVGPRDIRSAADLARIPITDKNALRSSPLTQVLANGVDADRLLARTTSGSDGRPFTVYRTWFEQNALHLFRLRAQRLLGLRLSDRFVTIGLIRERLRRDSKAIGRSLKAVGLYRRWRLDIFREPDALLDELERLRPDIVGGYPGVLARLADRIEQRGSSSLQPRFVLSGAEVLTDLYRRRIQTGFGAPVFDLYGCHELNLVAWQCPSTGFLHTCDDALVVEVLDGDRPVGVGERGEVVVTGLHSYAMPFLRYRLGDVVVRGEERCPCGAPFGTLYEIEGRRFEHFVLPDGRVIHPHRIGRMLIGAGQAIRQYQIVQERSDRVVLRIVPAPDQMPDVAVLERAAQSMLGPGVGCEVRLETAIPSEPNGKYRMYRSQVASGAGSDGADA